MVKTPPGRSTRYASRNIARDTHSGDSWFTRQMVARSNLFAGSPVSSAGACLSVTCAQVRTSRVYSSGDCSSEQSAHLRSATQCDTRRGSVKSPHACCIMPRIYAPSPDSSTHALVLGKTCILPGGICSHFRHRMGLEPIRAKTHERHRQQNEVMASQVLSTFVTFDTRLEVDPTCSLWVELP